MSTQTTMPADTHEQRMIVALVALYGMLSGRVAGDQSATSAALVGAAFEIAAEFERVAGSVA